MKHRLIRPNGRAAVYASLVLFVALCAFPAFAQSSTAVSPNGDPNGPILTSSSGKSAWPTSGSHNILVRPAPNHMGDNDSVSLWVHGDSSGACLRVRLLQTGMTDLHGADITAFPTWVSTSTPIDFSGWRHIVLGRDSFTLRGPSVAVDVDLPADAQADDSALTPDWSSIDALAIETSARTHCAFSIDDLAWGKLGSDGSVADAAPIDDFEQGDLAAWISEGTPDEKTALVNRLVTDPNLVHGGKVAMGVEIVPADYVRRTLYLPRVRKILAASQMSTLVFIPTSLFQTILPGALPSAGGAPSSLLVTMCPDQTQAASFCLYSLKNLKDVTVTLPPAFVSIGHSLKGGIVDVHVVKVGRQNGEGILQDTDFVRDSPSLLVKDDRIPLSGMTPDVPLTGDPITDIPADTTKQFWLTISVPKDTPAGYYSGALHVTAGNSPLQTVRLSIDVLPLRLLSPAKQYGIALRSRLDPAPAQLPSPDGRCLVTDFVTKDVLDEQLADISAHGVHIATLADSQATLWDALAEYRSFGMTDPYIYKGDGDPQAIESDRSARNEPSLLYYADPGPLSDAAARLANLNKGGLADTTYITSQSQYDALQADLDLPVYSVDCSYSQRLVQTDGQRVSSKRDWWYWPAATDDPVTNRVDAGFLLWRSRLYGAFLPAFQSAFGIDPYDETSAGAVAKEAEFRPEMLTYPARGGVIDTVQWEAVREGITDTRYLTTMYTALRECKDAKIDKPLCDEAETYVETFIDKPLSLLPETELDAARAKIAAYAVKLRKAVDGFNKTRPVQP